MLTAEDVRAVEFGYTTRGYKRADVDVFLEEVASALETLVWERTDFENKLRTLNRKIEEYQEAEGSIHTTLLNAQRMADQTVKEAGEAAGRVTSEANRKAQQMIEQAEEDVAAMRKAAEEEITARMNDAIAKSESIISAAHDSVARQQLLFDKLKAEAAAFKNLMIPKFEDLLSLMQKLPAEVPFGPERAAEALSFAYDQLPDFNAMAAAAKPVPEDKSPDPAPAKTAQPAGPANAGNAQQANTQPADTGSPQPADADRQQPAAAGNARQPASKQKGAPAQPAASVQQANPPAPAPVNPPAMAPAAEQPVTKKRPALQKAEIEAGRELGQPVMQQPAAPASPASAPKKGGFKIMVEDDEDDDMLGGLFEEDFEEEEKPRRGFFKKQK